MTIKRIGQGLAVLGIIGILLSLFVDVLPGTKPGIQSSQILGIEVSMLALLLGAWIITSGSVEFFEPGKYFRKLIEQLLNLPVVLWVLAGFLIVYVLFFVTPLFLNETHRMKYLITYLPDRYPIGNDLIAVLDLMKGWFFEGKSPYLVQFYPPFTYVFFAPLLLISNYPILFAAFTLFSVISFIILTFVLPMKIRGQKNLGMIMLVFLTGLISYGFQFELERGQYNVFTFLLCLLAIYIFHYHRKYRIFAYLIFSLSIQLKIYPAIFIVMFVDEWKDWKTIIRRFVGIGIFNFLFLFIMGGRIFLDFIRSVTTQLATPGWQWNGNHSIKAFVGSFVNDGLGIIPSQRLTGLQQHSGWLSMSLLLIFLASFVFAIMVSHSRREQCIDPYLLLTCMIGALIIPISNDYTLSILAAPMAIFLSALSELKNSRYRLVSIIFIFGLSLAYASVLIPFKFKPYALNNAFSALFIILICVTALNVIRYKRAPMSPSTE